MRNDSWMDAVNRAKSGDKEAMIMIINRFKPLIRKYKRTIARDLQQDYEQMVVETIIKKVKKYNYLDSRRAE